MSQKDETYTHKNDLKWFFDINYVTPAWIMEAIAGIYDLVAVSLADMGKDKTDPMNALKEFVHALSRNIKGPAKKLKRKNRIIDNKLDDLIRDIISGYSQLSIKEHDFKNNFLLSDFMEHVESAGLYL